MKTAQNARIADFARFVSNAHHSHHAMHEAHEAHTFDPVRFDARAYEQCDMRTGSMDRFSIGVDWDI
jgi:hypothetical protein